MGGRFEWNTQLSDDNWTLGEAVVEACNYIKDTVAFSLSREPTRMEHLSFLTQAITTEKAVHIFTLNHDILLERFLKKCGIPFLDGFGDPDNDVRYWSPGFVSSLAKGVAIYHLHGSVDWYRLCPINGTWEDERYGIPVKEDPWHTYALDGKRQWPVEGRSGFLIGTFNKILQYTDEIYIDLHCRFSEVLRKTRRVIICGYGFGDKAINSQLVRWLYTDPDSEPKKYLVVVHRDPDKLRADARGAVRNHWQEWVDSQRIVFVRKYVEKLKWTDLEPHL